MLLKFQLIKFEKQILFQVLDHVIDPIYWMDRGMDRKLLFNFTSPEDSINHEHRKTFTIYYNGQFQIDYECISLGLDMCRLDSVKKNEDDERGPKHTHKVVKIYFENNDIRDKWFDIYLDLLSNFTRKYTEPFKTFELERSIKSNS